MIVPKSGKAYVIDWGYVDSTGGARPSTFPPVTNSLCYWVWPSNGREEIAIQPGEGLINTVPSGVSFGIPLNNCVHIKPPPDARPHIRVIPDFLSGYEVVYDEYPWTIIENSVRNSSWNGRYQFSVILGPWYPRAAPPVYFDYKEATVSAQWRWNFTSSGYQVVATAASSGACYPNIVPHLYVSWFFKSGPCAGQLIETRLTPTFYHPFRLISPSVSTSTATASINEDSLWNRAVPSVSGGLYGPVYGSGTLQLQKQYADEVWNDTRYLPDWKFPTPISQLKWQKATSGKDNLTWAVESMITVSVTGGSESSPFPTKNTRSSLSRLGIVAPLRMDIFSGLVSDVYDAFVPFSGNGLAYIKDLKELPDMVKKLGNILAAIPGISTGAKLASTSAKAYLAWHYGIRLMIQDTKEILRALRRSGLSAYHTQRAEVTLDEGWYRISVACNDYDYQLNSLIDQLRRFDLLPTLENLWDLVPFSFVIDWFTGISSSLKAIDSLGYYSKLPILWSCVSQSVEYESTSVDYPGKYQVYQRKFLSNPLTPIRRLGQFPNSSLSNHFVEGAALIAANGGK
uniref:Putative maturation protein n=1 Tax=Ensystermes virus TaxID=2796588 RepID=A0A7T7K8Z9_9VIRU|nr:putative maturation protein [Ensystermes virus]